MAGLTGSSWVRAVAAGAAAIITAGLPEPTGEDVPLFVREGGGESVCLNREPKALAKYHVEIEPRPPAPTTDFYWLGGIVIMPGKKDVFLKHLDRLAEGERLYCGGKLKLDPADTLTLNEFKSLMSKVSVHSCYPRVRISGGDEFRDYQAFIGTLDARYAQYYLTLEHVSITCAVLRWLKCRKYDELGFVQCEGLVESTAIASSDRPIQTINLLGGDSGKKSVDKLCIQGEYTLENQDAIKAWFKPKEFTVISPSPMVKFAGKS